MEQLLDDMWNRHADENLHKSSSCKRRFELHGSELGDVHEHFWLSDRLLCIWRMPSYIERRYLLIEHDPVGDISDPVSVELHCDLLERHLESDPGKLQRMYAKLYVLMVSERLERMQSIVRRQWHADAGRILSEE